MIPRTILLVEDNADDVELAMYALERARTDNEVVVARDGEEALDYLFRTGAFAQRDAMPPALVLLDLKLPGIDGLAVLRRLRATADTRRIPVVVLTTSDDRADIMASYELGVNSYICKPVDFGVFTGVMDQVSRYWLSLNQPPPA